MFSRLSVDPGRDPVHMLWFRFLAFISMACRLLLSPFRTLDGWRRSLVLQWLLELWQIIPAPTLKACLTSDEVWWDGPWGGRWEDDPWGDIGLDACSSPDLRWWRHRSKRERESSNDVTSEVGRWPSCRLCDFRISTCWCNCWVQWEKASRDVSSRSLFSLWLLCMLASGSGKPFLVDAHSNLPSLPSSTVHLLLSYIGRNWCKIDGSIRYSWREIIYIWDISYKS